MRRPKWWGLLSPVIVILVVVSLIPLAAIYVARSSMSVVPRLSIIPDMDNQPRYKAQQSSPLFADERVMRRPVEGTIPRGVPVENPHLTEGIVDDAWATTLPPEIEINEELLEWGHNRFDIYCAVCHGFDGSGQSFVDTRATELEQMTWIAPSSYHTPTVHDRPVGHLYNTITNGIRTMPAYKKQLGIYDRWAVVAYVRALQLSQSAGLEDVPAAERVTLENMVPPPPEPEPVPAAATGQAEPTDAAELETVDDPANADPAPVAEGEG